MTVTEQLAAQHDKAAARRFNAEAVTGFGDLFIARVDAASNTRFLADGRLAWIEKPQRIHVLIGTSNDPYCSKPTEWLPTVMSRSEAARALRCARREGLRIEQSVKGFEISGAFR